MEKIMAELTLQNIQVKHIGPINLCLLQGKCFAVSGPSGAGKTLLLRAIADLDPHQGEMWLNGQSYLDFSGSAWRKQVGMLPAHIVWWHATVGQHFATAVNLDWLSLLGFTAEVMAWPVSRLSMGESQRLGLLRLLSQNPQVLLLDEPTANLDEENIHNVEQLLRLYQNTAAAAILWVTHQQAQIKRVAHQHYALIEGRLVLQEIRNERN